MKKRTDIMELLREKMINGVDEIEAINMLEQDENVDKEALGKWAEKFNNWRANKNKSR